MCYCGDQACWACGPAQGIFLCPVCREAECEEPEACKRKERLAEQAEIDAFVDAHEAWSKD